MSDEEDDDDIYNLDEDDEDENKSPQNIEITYSDEEKVNDDDDDDDDDDEVEKIIDRRVEPSGLVDYKVHWKNTTADSDEWFARAKLISMYTNLVVEYEENHKLLSTPAQQFRRSLMPTSTPRLSLSRPVSPATPKPEPKYENISASIIQNNFRKHYEKRKRQKLEEHLAKQIYIAYRNNKLILATIKIQSLKCLVNQIKEEKEKQLKEEENSEDDSDIILPDPIKFPDPEDEIKSFNSFRIIEENSLNNIPKEIRNAINLIQKTWRIYKYHIKSLGQIINDRIKKKREKMKRKINKEKQMKIQLFLSKLYKGKKVRKEYRKRIEIMKMIQIWISRYYRGKKQRKEYKLIKEMIKEEELNKNRINSIIIIQKYVRRFINRHKYIRIKKSIIIVQSIIRMYINKYKYKTINTNIIRIQKFLHNKYANKKQFEINLCKEIIENDIIYNKVWNEIDKTEKQKVILFLQKYYRGKRDRLYFKKLKHILLLLNEFKYMKKASLNQDVFNNNKINIIKQKNCKDRIYFQCYCIPNHKYTKGIIDIWSCSFHQKVFLYEIYEYITNNNINIDYKCGCMISFQFENVTSNITVLEQKYDIFYLWDFPVRFPIHYTINNKNNNSKNLYEEIRISVYVLGVFYCILNVKIPIKFNNQNKLNYYKIRTTLTYIIPEPKLHNNNNLAVLLIDDSVISLTNPIISQTINQLKSRDYGIYILSNKLITNHSIEIICKLYLNNIIIKWNQLFIISLLLVEKQIIGPVVENPIYEPPENNYILTYNDHSNNNSFTSNSLSTESITSISSSTVSSDNSNNNISKLEVSKYLKLFHSIPSNLILVYIPQLSFNIFIPANFDNNNNNEYMQLISSILTPSKFLQVFNQTLSTLKERISIEMFAAKLNKMNNNSTFMRNVLKSMILIKMKEFFIFEPTEESINNNNYNNNMEIYELLFKYKNFEYQIRLIQNWFINRIKYKYNMNLNKVKKYTKIIENSTLSLSETKPKLQQSMNYLIHTNRILNNHKIKHILPPPQQQLPSEQQQQLENESNNNNNLYEEKINQQNKEIKELKLQLKSLRQKILEKETISDNNNNNKSESEIIFKPTTPPKQQQQQQLFRYTHIFTPEPDEEPDEETSTQYIRSYRRVIKPTPPSSSSSKKRHSSANTSAKSHRSIRRSLF